MRLRLPHQVPRSASLGLLGIGLLLAACSTPSTPTPTAMPQAPPSAAPAPTEPPTPAPTPTAEPTLTHAEKAASLTSETTERITYAIVDGEKTDLDVYVPDESGPWPVVIVAHGIGQNRRSLSDLAEAISSQGAVVYNVDLDFSFPIITGIERAACAVRFARATANIYGGDPSRIILVGNSDGALSGAVVALAGDAIGGDCVVADTSAQLQALVGYEGPYNKATFVYNATEDHTVFEQEDPELWHAIDPYFHIGGNPDVQIRLVHGDDVDRLWFDVRPEVSIRFHQALVDASYVVELIMIEEGDHTDLGNSESDAFAVVLQQVLELTQSLSQ